MKSKPHYLAIVIILLIAYSLCHVSYKVGYWKGSDNMYTRSQEVIDAKERNIVTSDSLINAQRKLIKLQDSMIFSFIKP